MQKTVYRIIIDADLWNQFKSKCAANGKSMIEVLTTMIKNYIKEV